MKVYHEKGKHPGETHRFFDLESFDPYYTANVLNVLYDNWWHSILITNGTDAFHHTFTICKIGDTNFFDIEPLVGYSGPVSTTGDSSFLSAALEEYSKFCFEKKIVAELVRFNPYLRNYKVWEKVSPRLNVVVGKPIVYIPLHADEKEQMKVYSKYCRRDVRRVLSEYEVTYPDKKTADWDMFTGMYRDSMKRVSASSYWLFDDGFFQRLSKSTSFGFVGIKSTRNGANRLIAASVVIHGVPVSYHFLTANINPSLYVQANKLFVHLISAWTAGKGAQYLCLGGGNTDRLNDPLLFFKQRFSRYHEKLPLGFFIHNQKIFNELVHEASTHMNASDGNRTDSDSPIIFLNYRLHKPFNSGRMRPLEVDL